MIARRSSVMLVSKLGASPLASFRGTLNSNANSGAVGSNGKG